MKKRNKLFAIVLVLMLTMSVTISAFAAEVSADIDCERVVFTGTVGVGEWVRLEVRLHETIDWQSPMLQDDYIVVSAPGPFNVTVPWVDPDGDVDGQLHRVAASVSTDGGNTWIKLGSSFGEGPIECPPPPGGGFCSPGYFKKHLDAWGPTGYAPGDDFDTVFGVDYFDPDITLLDAVNLKGGGVNALARTGTASLLSAAHPGVNYPLTEAEVIAAVQAGDKALLDQYIDFDCPID